MEGRGKRPLDVLLEVFGGVRWQIDIEPDFDAVALRDYFAAQGRFRDDGIDLSRLAVDIRQNWDRLRRQIAVGGEE